MKRHRLDIHVMLFSYASVCVCVHKLKILNYFPQSLSLSFSLSIQNKDTAQGVAQKVSLADGLLVRWVGHPLYVPFPHACPRHGTQSG